MAMRKILNGYSAQDVQKYFDSIPEGDIEHGLKHQYYAQTIYRNIIGGQGFVELYKSPHGGASIAVSVHPDARRKGIGTALVTMAQEASEDLGIDKIEWYCRKANEASVRLAQKCGFEVDEDLSSSDWYVLVWLRQEEVQ